MIRIKLTDEHGYTRKGKSGETLWTIGVTVKADTSLPAELCTAGVIHGYETALLAVLMNAAHANYDNPRGWEIEVPEVVVSDGTKEGYREATLKREIVLPEVTTEQRVRFSVLCALEVYQEPSFVKWANDWLRGKDRSYDTAHATSDASYVAANAAARAYSAAYATSDTDYATATVAVVAANANTVAANAAAAISNKRINFAALAQKAVDEEREGKC